MNKFLLLTGLLAVNFSVLAQTPPAPRTHYFNSGDYATAKLNGTLPDGHIIILDTTKPGKPDLSALGGPKAAGCGCYIEPDGSYTLAMAPNDDGSTGVISIPFNFCLYGTNYNQLYINNNGNVSFGTSYGTYSASGFPSASFVMVAPFWADVDTRGGFGQVLYKIYPNAIYVNWVDVGYFNTHGDKRNTFQLILSDGTDTTVGVGNNVAFCYEDMQWTTGDASSGVGGFGGVPATVGANKGDGTSFIQFGRFDQAGTAYDGPVGLSDGISWLDYQSFKFSTCVTTSNVEPIFVDFSPSLANLSFDCGTGDTVKVCSTGDTLVMSAQVLDPNVGDSVFLSVDGTGIYGFQILADNPGNPATITWQFVADPSNAGFNIFTVTATDNGTPNLSATATVTIFVDTTGTGALNATITGDTLLCDGETTTLTVDPGLDTYEWSDGSATNVSNVISAGGLYYVTISNNSCYKTIQQMVYELPDPAPPVYGNFSICGTSTSTALSTDPIYTSYNWATTSGSISTTENATVSSLGNVTLTVVDTNGCTGDTTISITAGPTVNVTGPITACTPSIITLTATASGTTGTYLWSTTSTASSITVSTSGTYVVTYTDPGGCTAVDSQTVAINTTPDIIITTPDSTVCAGQTITLTVGGTLAGGSIMWSTAATGTSINVTSGTTYSVTVNNAGCTDTDNITVTFNALPTVNISGLLESCANVPITLTATGSTTGTYTWSSGENTASIVPGSSGSYTVTFTDANGCTDTDVETITYHPVPNASFTASATSPLVPSSLPAEVDFTSTSTIASPGTIVGYSWTVNDTLSGTTSTLSHDFTYYGNNVITLYVVSDEGCVDSVSMEFEISPMLLIPNIFTPETTPGVNDNFAIQSLWYFSPASMKIFNRWGQLVHETDNYDQNLWDGKKDGSACAEGVYYFELILKDGEVHTGHVTLKR